MAIRQVDFRTLGNEDYVPQAIIKATPAELKRRLGITFISGCDDLDYFKGAALALDGGITFALKQYKGHPADTTSIYLPGTIRDEETITALVEQIRGETRTAPSALIWQRKDGLDF